MTDGFQMVIRLTEGESSPAFLTVCASTVVARLALLAKRAGASEIVLVGASADVARAQGILAKDVRLEGTKVVTGEPAPAARRVEATANVVISSEIMKMLAAANAPVFVPGAPDARVPGESATPLFATLPEGAFVLPINSAADVPHARREVLSKARSAGSSPVARHLHEKFSQPLSRLLAETPATANQVTFVNTVLGLLAAYYWSVGTLTALALGGILMQVTSILDCVDGELARGKMLESKWGAWFDTVGDHVVNFAWVIGLGVGYGRFGAGREVPWAEHVGSLSLTMVVLSFTLVAGLFLQLLATRAGTKLKDVATSFRESSEKKSALFRLLDKFYVLGRRASIALFFTICAVLPAMGLVVFYDVLFFVTVIFLFFANVYILIGAVNTRLRATRAA
jgi:phosphatidylglycerophosphate synthase